MVGCFLGVTKTEGSEAAGRQAGRQAGRADRQMGLLKE